MRRDVDFLIQFIQFAGVVVAAAAVLVAVVRVAVASLAGDRSRRMTTISLDLARTVLIGLDLLLVSAALDAAISVQRASFIRLGTVAGLRVALTLLVSFELAFRTDTASDPGESRWPRPLRRPAPARPATRLVAADRAAENLWPDRARLGRHG